jgi:hypothetical protein
MIMRIQTLCASLCVLALLSGPSPAAEKTSTGTSQPRRLKPPKPPANTGPGETRKEREQRLLRECRGKPNAGACEGYAH